MSWSAAGEVTNAVEGSGRRSGHGRRDGRSPPSLILAVVPTVESTSAQVVVPDDPKTEPVRLERRPETLLADGGWPRTAFLLAPAAISAVPLALSHTRLGRPASVVAAVLTWLFVIATGFSIGLLYVPAAVALVVAAANFPSQSVAVNQYIYGKALFDTTATTPGDVKTHTHSFPFHFEDPSWAGPSNSVADTQVPVRCDNAVPGYSVTGCVYPQYTPSVSYSRTGSYPVLAQHIADAQASGLRGAYPAGTPLTRLTNSALIAANRSTSCKSSYAT